MVSQWKSIQDVIDYAIGEENQAIALYREMAASAESAEVGEILYGFAEEELVHRAKLTRLKTSLDEDRLPFEHGNLDRPERLVHI